MTPLITAIRTGLATRADPTRADAMRRYMKSDMPMRGVPQPERAALGKVVFAEHTFTTTEPWLSTVLELWRDAEYREERYLALDLIGHRRYRTWQTPALLPTYEEMIVTGAWWDFVDEIATRRLNDLMLTHRAELTPTMRTWASDPDRWKRRSSILCQLHHKQDTDLDLLTHTITTNTADPDFFLRKAIGWALRQHARTDPDWVRTFTDTHNMSPLSRKEALKHLT